MPTRLLILPLLLACALAPPAHAGEGIFVGAAEDAARSPDPVVSKTKMDIAKLAGFDAIRMTSIWSPGQSAPTPHELLVLRNAGAAAQLNGIRLILSVYHKDQRTTPLTARARADFASYVATIAREVPGISDYIIGNEPNLNLFWMPQYTRTGANAAAPAYVRLLAQTYDAVKAVSPDVNVIGGSISPRGQDKYPSKRHTHSPTTFIPDMGTAYRKSRRTRPIMDAFAFHPYLIPSRLPPTFRFKNPKNTTVALSDYDKLTRLLARAFDGTAQAGSTLPIVYDEFGYQSIIPPHKQRFYTNLDSPAARDAIPEATQAAYYRQALAIAQCQPNVTGILLFHVTDESDARTWQSGVFYADDTPKSSLPAVRQAALAAQRGTHAACPRPKRVNPVDEVVFPPQAPAPGEEPAPGEPPSAIAPDVESPGPDPAKRQVQLVCAQACRFVARLERVLAPGAAFSAEPAQRPNALRVDGFTSPRNRHTVQFPLDPLAPGTYQYVIRVTAVGKAGTAVTRFSDPFTVPAPQPEESEPAPSPGAQP